MTWDLYPDEKGSNRVTQVHRGNGYTVAGTTGTMAAALAQNAFVFAMRAATGLAGVLEIRRVRLQWTTIAAFTTPITAGRSLGLYRGAAGTPSGGTALTPRERDTGALSTLGGLAAAAQIATTAALTLNSATKEAEAQALMTLVHAGAAGAYVEELFEFYGETAPISLNAGELLAIAPPAAMDAGGTWQLGVTVDYLVNVGKMVR